MSLPTHHHQDEDYDYAADADDECVHGSWGDCDDCDIAATRRIAQTLAAKQSGPFVASEIEALREQLESEGYAYAWDWLGADLTRDYLDARFPCAAE